MGWMVLILAIGEALLLAGAFRQRRRMRVVPRIANNMNWAISTVDGLRERVEKIEQHQQTLANAQQALRDQLNAPPSEGEAENEAEIGQMRRDIRALRGDLAALIQWKGEFEAREERREEAREKAHQTVQEMLEHAPAGVLNAYVGDLEARK